MRAIRKIRLTGMSLVMLCGTWSGETLLDQHLTIIQNGAARADRNATAPAIVAQQEALEHQPENASEHELMVRNIKQIFCAAGLPPALVWVAEVESSWNPEAQSKAGAVGLFQFMPETARRFGLKTDHADERTLPAKSALAAASYLGLLHEQFGSWRLALAAYNAGEGRVERAIQATGSRRFRKIAPFLPEETQRYVQKVLTTIALREGERYSDA